MDQNFSREEISEKKSADVHFNPPILSKVRKILVFVTNSREGLQRNVYESRTYLANREYMQTA